MTDRLIKIQESINKILNQITERKNIAVVLARVKVLNDESIDFIYEYIHKTSEFSSDSLVDESNVFMQYSNMLRAVGAYRAAWLTDSVVRYAE